MYLFFSLIFCPTVSLLYLDKDPGLWPIYLYLSNTSLNQLKPPREEIIIY
ncbi:unnamed protein product [Moneuplotes crassus]|uniref:Uncharacterized protein n=1 Tax=Euplotes crassus TaxID=5936 RepID=A0AAD1UJZ0_EUPCR|nr:unnamed protein product [Moneuplotes crassus]